MRAAGIALTTLLPVTLVTSCNTTQPLGIESGMARVDYAATLTPLKVFDVYPSILVDTSSPFDGIPDEKRPVREGTFPAPSCAEVQNQFRNAPIAWPFAVEITLLSRNSTEARVIESTQTPGGRFGFVRATPGDTASTPLPDRPIDPPVFVAGGRAVAYTDGVQVSEGNNFYWETCTPVGPGGIPPYQASTFDVKPGDLIKVSVRPFSGLDPNTQSGRFRATLMIDGTEVGVRGQSVSVNFEEGIAFTYPFE